MSLDVFVCYQRLCQQARRAGTSKEQKVRKRICALVIATCKPGASAKQRLTLAERAAKLEATLPFGTYRYARKVLDAVVAAEADFTNVPYSMRHALTETRNAKGYIYIAVAATRPGESKLGSSVDPKKRLALYSRKYGYETTVYWAAYVMRLRSFEKNMEKQLAEYRVSFCTPGNSNEWYQMSASELQARLESAISARGISIVS